jgi:hypothetical protein
MGRPNDTHRYRPSRGFHPTFQSIFRSPKTLTDPAQGRNPSLATVAVIALCLVPLTAMLMPAVLRLSAPPSTHARFSRYSIVLDGGLGRAWCRNGAFAPAPNGYGYSCALGGEFQCQADGCVLLRYKHGIPRGHWDPIQDPRNGSPLIRRGETRWLEPGRYYSARPAPVIDVHASQERSE